MSMNEKNCLLLRMFSGARVLSIRIFSLAVVTLLVLVWVNGCGPLIPTNNGQKEFYVLTADESVPKNSGKRWKYRILVRDAKGNRFINSHKIVFSDDPAKRGYYQLAQWVEPPTKQFTSLLLERLERTKIAVAVSRLASSTLGDIQLNTEIEEFYHDITERPGKVRVQVSAELVDLNRRIVIDKKEFEKTIQANEYSAEGAVSAFSSAVNQIIDEIVVWVSLGAESLALSNDEVAKR